MQFCSQCGQGNAEDASFCVQCGAPMPGAQQAQSGAAGGTPPPPAGGTPPPPPEGSVPPPPPGQPPPPPQAQWTGAPPPPGMPPGPWVPPPAYPPYPAMTTQKYSGVAVASMVLGIVSIVIYPLGLILGTLGILFWKNARDELIRDHTAKGESFATAGLVCGIVGASLSAIFWIAVIIAVAT